MSFNPEIKNMLIMEEAFKSTYEFTIYHGAKWIHSYLQYVEPQDT